MASSLSINPLQDMFTSWKGSLTSRVSGRKAVPYTNIEEVIKDPNASKGIGFLDMIKWGHAWASLDIVFGGVFTFIAKKCESNFWKYLFGFFGVTNFLGAAVNLLVGTFCKNPVEEEMNGIIPKYVEKLDAPSFGLNEVYLEDSHKTTLNLQVQEAKNRGVVINIYGTIGNGKTMTGKAMACELQRQGVCKKATFWNAKEEFLKVSSVDKFGGAVKLFGFTLVDGETIPQRVERIVANAIAHYKQTGEYVVIGLDEAQVLIEGHDTLFDRKYKRSSTNPNDRPPVIQAFSKIVDRVQDKSGDCKGVILMIMSNSSGNKFVFLERRMPNLEYKRPNQALRLKFIKDKVPELLKKHGVQNVSLTENDYERLAEIGTEDIHSKYQEVFYKSSFTGEESTHDRTPDFMKPYKNELKAFDVLHFDALEKTIEEAAYETKNGSTKLFHLLLGEKLETKSKAAAGNLKQIEDEFKSKTGKESIFDW